MTDDWIATARYIKGKARFMKHVLADLHFTLVMGVVSVVKFKIGIW